MSYKTEILPTTDKAGDRLTLGLPQVWHSKLVFQNFSLIVATPAASPKNVICHPLETSLKMVA